MQVKLLLFTFYLNGRLHAVPIGKLSERMLNFWTVRLLKTEYEPNFGFPHIARWQTTPQFRTGSIQLPVTEA